MAVANIERPEQRALVALDAELARRREVIEASAASMIDPDRMRGVVLSAFTRQPKLFDCDPVTVVRAVVEAAQVGLEPTGAIGGAHLVPRWSNKTKRQECQLIIDYRGYVQLAKRSQEISRVVARIVREQDEFDYEQGTNEWLRHKPAMVPDPGPFTFAYAIAFFRDGGSQFDVMSSAEIEAHKQRFAPRDKGGNITGPWVTDPGEMWKKTVVRRLSKLLPLTIEARAIIAFEDEQTDDRGSQPARVDKSSRLRSRLQARLAGGENTDPNGEGQADIGQGESGDAPAGGDSPEVAATDVDPADAPDACPATSPYGDDAPCVREAGHTGNHKAGSAETWA